MRSVAAALLLVITGAALLPATSGCSEVSASIHIMSDVDYKYNCFQALNSLREVAAASTVNFIVTHFWAQTGRRITQFCYRLGRHYCAPVTQELVDVFTQHFTKCLQHAEKLGFNSITITPQMDDADFTVNRWRNLLQLNPLQELHGWSYKTFHIEPILQAVKAADVRTAVHMSMQGEMNAAILAYTSQWRTLRNSIKASIPNIKVGVSHNFNSLCSGALCQRANATQLTSLYRSLDFLGLSAYAHLPKVYFPLAALAGSASAFAEAMLQLGVDVKAIFSGPNKEVQYTEFGVGGGLCGGARSTGCVATTPAQVIAKPFYGLGSSYHPDRDPWLYPDNRAYLSYFYTKAAQFAMAEGAQGWRVRRIFIWGRGSYDVLGVHPYSTNGFGTWRVPAVAQLLAAHNKVCRGLLLARDHKAATVGANPDLAGPAPTQSLP